MMMTIDDYKKLITQGVVIPLQNLKFHEQAPLNRLLMSGLGAEANYDMHIAIHEIKDELPFQLRDYSKKHSHNCKEYNIILGENLTFQITLDSEIFEVSAPATIYIPAGIVHSANALKGKGYFIAIVDTMDYDNSFVLSE
jgi:mannose-6-phosphate isomerase-like protein (cupin superfamily)